MSQSKVRQPEEVRQQEPTLPSPVLRAEELFRGRREVYIEHDGKQYRLRITRRNKLILQK